jgi:flagellar basal body-associated protein FliL
MKIEFFKKKDDFKKKTFVINPNFYWKIVVLIAVILVIFSFVFGYYFFVQINQEFVLPDTNTGGQVGKVNKDRIEKVLNYFSDREQTSKEILNSPVPVVDPSQ